MECGALNGEYMSNTIDLERKFNWSGMLIEANPETFKSLLSRNRKAWTLPVCLSLEPFPTQVHLNSVCIKPFGQFLNFCIKEKLRYLALVDFFRGIFHSFDISFPFCIRLVPSYFMNFN